MRKKTLEEIQETFDVNFYSKTYECVDPDDIAKCFHVEKYIGMYGLLSKDDEPAWVEYNSGLIVIFKGWYKRGRLHRENGKPTRLQYYDTGELRVEEYHNKHGYHRDDDRPAYVHYNIDGTIKYYEYHVNGFEKDREVVDRRVKLNKRKNILKKARQIPNY